MDRLERLVNLVAALLDAERPLGREELRRRVGGYAGDQQAFRRTFERDKDVLRQMGMPLVTEPIDPERPDDSVGYRIPRESYELADPGLDDDELAALRLAASAVAVEGSWGPGVSIAALRKLAATVTVAPSQPSPGPTGPGGHQQGPTGQREVATLPGGDRVAVAFAAVAERRCVAFEYRGVPRQVQPWHLSYRKGEWYLSGLDAARGGERMFRLDRVEGPMEATGLPAAFDRPAGGAVAPPPPWRLGDGEEAVVDVLVDGSHAGWVVDEVGEGAVAERRADGAVRLALRVTSRDGLRSLVLGLLDHAEVLGPPEVRADVMAWLADLAGAPSS